MRQFIVDAFTDRVFSGNPAAVCILDSWPADGRMVAIAGENNLSETAFAVRDGGEYRLRWFTPSGEIDLCGHATLACACVIMNYVEPERDSVAFETLSGRLTVIRRGDLYEMDFPGYTLRRVPVTEAMAQALGAMPSEAYLGRDLLCVFDSADTVRSLQPDLGRIQALEGLLVHATAPGRDTDCVSRTFAPKCGVPEDPVCGSGHCHIVPYWTGRLDKRSIVAYQASRRGGTLYCAVEGDRVKLSGKAAVFSIGEIFPDC